MRVLAAIGLLLFAVGCAAGGTAQTRAILNFAVACESYATSLELLEVRLRTGRLSDGQIATINEVRPILRATCQGPPPQNINDALGVVEDGVFKLMIIERKSNANR